MSDYNGPTIEELLAIETIKRAYPDTDPKNVAADVYDEYRSALEVIKAHKKANYSNKVKAFKNPL